MSEYDPRMYEKDFIIGKKGEEMIIELLRKHGYKVKDVSDEPYYQAIDVDLIVNDTSKIEIKTSSRIVDYSLKNRVEWGNLWIEEGKRDLNGNRLPSLGWANKCQADYIVFLDCLYGDIYVCDWVKLRLNSLQNTEFLRSKPNKEKAIDYFRLYPIQHGIEAGFIIPYKELFKMERSRADGVYND